MEKISEQSNYKVKTDKCPVFFNYVKAINYELVKSSNENSFHSLKKIEPESFYKAILKL